MSTEVEGPPESATSTDPVEPDVTAGQPAAPEPVVPPRPPRRRLRWPKLGIQSKLLLATSIISCVLVGVVGYRSGRDGLREAAFEQLTFVRNSRARGMVREYTRLENAGHLHPRQDGDRGHRRSPRGDIVMTGQLPPGQILGLAGLTRQRILAGAVATTEIEVLTAPIEHVEELMRHNAQFARDLGRAIDIRTRSQVAAWTALTAGRQPEVEAPSANLLRASTR